MSQNEKFHSIQHVSTKLKIPKPTLRYWEKEFDGILLPDRTNGGQRRYSPEHVSTIKEIKKLKKAGLSLTEIKNKLSGELTLETGELRLGDGSTVGIDILVERVTEVVKVEVLKVLRTAEKKGSRHKLNT